VTRGLRGRSIADAEAVLQRIIDASAPLGGDGTDGIVRDPAHWAVCLFPRDAHGNVVGWFMEFHSRRDLINALGDGISTNAIVRLQ
jgi:hypothetical protein